MKRFATALAATALVTCPALAQETPDAESADMAPAIGGAFGSTLERQTMAFYDEIAAPATGDRGLARWNTPVCVSAENLDAEAAQFMIDRISVIALQLGADFGEPGCAPNIDIIFTTDGQLTASALVEANGRAMSTGVSGTDRGDEALSAFARSDRPVRWWLVSSPTDARSGRRMVQLPGDPSFGDPDFGGVHRDVGGGSRLYTQERQDLVRAAVIVDVNMVEGLNWTQLADYLAMVTLAQIDPGADTSGFDTILNLFDAGGDAPARMTAWDLTYLQALYTTDPLRQPATRSNDVANMMARLNRERAALSQ